MRHTAVSLWIASGASDTEIANYAGHRSSFFSEDRYGHLFAGAGAILAERLDALIDSVTSSPPQGQAELSPNGRRTTPRDRILGVVAAAITVNVGSSFYPLIRVRLGICFGVPVPEVCSLRMQVGAVATA